MIEPADTAAPPAPPRRRSATEARGATSDSQEVLSKAGFGMRSGLIQILIRGVTHDPHRPRPARRPARPLRLSNRIAKVGSLFSLSGQDDAVVHFVARYRGTGEPGEQRRVRNLSFLIATGLSLVMGVLVYVCRADWAAREEFKDSRSRSRRWSRRSSGSRSPSRSACWAASSPRRRCRARDEVKKSLATQNLVVPGVRLVLSAILAACGSKLFGAAWPRCSARSSSDSSSAGWYVKKLDWMAQGVEPDYSEWKGVAILLRCR